MQNMYQVKYYKSRDGLLLEQNGQLKQKRLHKDVSR